MDDQCEINAEMFKLDKNVYYVYNADVCFNGETVRADLVKITMPSSNGRTTGFGPVNHGSNPCGITIKHKWGEDSWEEMEDTHRQLMREMMNKYYYNEYWGD